MMSCKWLYSSLDMRTMISRWISLLGICGVYFHEAATAQSLQNRNGDIRLQGGASEKEGRVEIFFGQRWGTVCDIDFLDVSAIVACRQLGLAFTEATSWRDTATYGEGTGPIWLSYVRCTGSEDRLADCPYSDQHGDQCPHQNDVGVRCAGSIIQTGKLRLVDGPSEQEGRLEVFTGASWSTVCSDGFEPVDAKVACAQLGFSTSNVIVHPDAAPYGSGNGSIVASVSCLGTEEQLVDCRHEQGSEVTCTHDQDVGIGCREGSSMTTSASTTETSGAAFPANGTLFMVIGSLCASVLYLVTCIS